MSAVVKSRSWSVWFSDGYFLHVTAATARRAATAAAVLRNAANEVPARSLPGFVTSVRYMGDTLTRDISEDIAVEEDLP